MWTEETFVTDLKTVCDAIGRFPTVSELRKHGRNDLACQIVRRGGFRAWSEKLGVPFVHSDSDTGWDGELAFSQLLTSLGFTVTVRKSMKCPYDLLVDGCVRVDVKTAKYASYGNSSTGGVSSGWFYRIGKDVPADIVALYRSDRSDCYLIPWDRCNNSNITITPTGKTYAKYHNAYALLRMIIESRKQEQEITNQ
jgi:hypothetical protein